MVYTIEDGQLAGSQLVKMHWKIEKKVRGKRRSSPIQSRYFLKGKEGCLFPSVGGSGGREGGRIGLDCTPIHVNSTGERREKKYYTIFI